MLLFTHYLVHQKEISNNILIVVEPLMLQSFFGGGPLFRIILNHPN
jgi:hypothetical protein